MKELKFIKIVIHTWKALVYQTVHVFSRGLHPNALLNSGKLESGTRTLKLKERITLLKAASTPSYHIRKTSRFSTRYKFILFTWKGSSLLINNWSNTDEIGEIWHSRVVKGEISNFALKKFSLAHLSPNMELWRQWCNRKGCST